MTKRPRLLSGSQCNPHRRALIAKIHVARKEMNMETEDYRSLVERISGKASCADCSIGQLEDVLAEMKRLGFVAKPAVRKTPARPVVRKVYALWNAMGPLLRSEGSQEALRAFVERQAGVSAPEFLDDAQAYQVIEALKRWRDRLGVEAEG
ncbi:regulatory protein GemA [Acetobacter sicerae]|uniref:Regulatory protein GemA n=1 Tax=Acetobacter sicerae TaxID=85325 RepID=A0ABS8W0P6_9PROT|nr:regulatory protein GemA [Acetobacter sicerae]MCE0745468.1 regulatory protein GemA [Acetobacter sicerae]